MIIIPDLPDVQVEEVEVAFEITLTLRTTSPTASCPACGSASSRIQSRYTRTLRDLPSSGRPIRLILQVRRFFWKESTCAQKIFTERLPDLCRPHAQRTKRLLRKFADSSNGSDKVEKAVRLVKHIGTFPTGGFLSNISELA